MRFVAFDGEGSDGKYQLLAASVGEPIVAEEGLSTEQCFSFFAKLLLDGTVSRTDAFVGFGLGYDFEMMLRDIPDEDYRLLAKGRRVRYGPFKVNYVERKFLDVGFEAKGQYWSYRLNDIYPYFQQSFIKACGAYGIELPDVVYEGKRNRSNFSFDNIEQIITYNAAELEAMVKLASALRDDFVKAFDRVAVSPRLGKRDWYGPGAQAGAIMRTIKYHDELALDNEQRDRITRAVTKFYRTDEFYRDFVSEKLHQYAVYLLMVDPFAAAYFGGRIEASLQGKLEAPLYDYDLISAYPYAMTCLPVIRGKKVRKIRKLDPKERVGMYLIEWKLAEAGYEALSRGKQQAYGPLPMRSPRDGNVYFPVTSGLGWYLSPEVYSLEQSPRINYRILDAYVFDGTEGYGRGTRKGDSHLAQFVELMGRVRAQAKAEGDPAHRGLKLLMNSLYGKTLQKVGSRTYFNAFVAAWITSVTRARIYDLIRDTTPGQVVSVMTDGVLSRVPLPAVLGNELGQWERTTYERGYQFAPGIYVLYDKEGKETKKYRGFAKFDADAAIAAFEQGGIYHVMDTRFVSRSFALHVRKYYDQMYRFIQIPRKEDFSLASKRLVGEGSPGVDVGPLLKYYDPKYILFPIASYPYDVIDKNESVLKRLQEEVRRDPEQAAISRLV